MGGLGTTLRTVRHLRPGQVANRLIYEVRRRLSQVIPARWPRLEPARFQISVSRPVQVGGEERLRAESLAGGAVSYLALSGDASNWDHRGKSRLWSFEHHYHREVLSAALMRHAEGQRWTAIAGKYVEQWASACPPPRGDGWEPYPVARRILNWALAGFIDAELGAGLAPALRYQVKYLSRRIEWHLLGNHLLCDAAALVAGGAVLAGREADQAWRVGEELLATQLARQVLPDGGYAERTVQYHAIVLQDVLIAAALSREAQRPVRERILETASQMAAWLARVAESGRIPCLNDAAPDATPDAATVLSLASALGIAPPRWNGWLGRVFGPVPATTQVGEPANRDIHLESTGWYIAREGGHELLFDYGPIGPDEQPGHGHSDTLGFELCWDGRPIVTDTGVTTYEIGPVRNFERSAGAHATVTVSGHGADELWAAFRVGARGRATGRLVRRTPEGARILAGTLSAPGGWSHERQIVFWPGEALVVVDRVVGATGEVRSHVPLAPTCDLSGGTLHPEGGQPLAFTILAGELAALVRGSHAPHDGWSSRGFGRPTPRWSIAIRAAGDRIAYAIHRPSVTVELFGVRCMVRGACRTAEFHLGDVL